MQKIIWKKFSSLRKKIVGRSIVFRCLTKLPGEEWVDFMLIEDCYSPSSYSVMVVSGMKAGQLLVKLPTEARFARDRYGISMGWLKKNWKQWICDVDFKNIFFLPTFIMSSSWEFEVSPYGNVSTPWVRLLKLQTLTIHSGAVFRFQAKWPYEEWVDFMLIANSDSPSGFAMMVTSGYKAGLMFSYFPAEAKSVDGNGISTKWFVENWKKWVYEKGPRSVFYLERFNVDPNWSLECVSEQFVSMNRDIKV